MSRRYLPLLGSSTVFALTLVIGACDPHPPLNEGGDEDGSNVQSQTPDDSEDPSSSNNETETGSVADEDSGDDDDDSSPAESDEESETGETTGEDTDEGTGDEEDTTDGYEITASMLAIDAAGKGIAEFGIQFCGPIVDGVPLICYIGVADDDGVVRFEKGLQPGWWSAKFLPGTKFPDRKFAGNAVRIDLEDKQDFEAGPIIVPEVETLISLDPEETEPQELALTDKLTLKVAPSDISFLSASNHDVGAVQVDEKFWPITELAGEEVLGMWAFSLFGNQSKEDKLIDFKLEDSLGLDPDDKVNIYELDKELGEFKKAVEGQVSSDGKSISPKEGKGLHYLTWMAITVPKD